MSLTDDQNDPRLGHEVKQILAELQAAVAVLNPTYIFGSERRVINEYRRRRNICALTNYLAAHPCACGEDDPVVLDFDHRDNEKIGGVRANLSMLAAGASLERLAREIAKCDVRCANCHRRRTAKQLNWHRYLVRRPFEEPSVSYD